MAQIYTDGEKKFSHGLNADFSREGNKSGNGAD